jgi:hypothetical protein
VPTFASEFSTNGIAMTMDNECRLYLLDPLRVLVNTVYGKLVATWEPQSLIGTDLSPDYIEYNNGRLFIISGRPTPSRIGVYDIKGLLVDEWPERHDRSVGGLPWRIDQIAIDEYGYIYTLRFYEESLVKYAPDGTFEREWLTHGTNPTGYNWPGGIVVGPNKVVYISDTFHDRILMFSTEGDLVGEIGEEGTGEGQLSWPLGLAIDEYQVLYVADLLNYRIQKLTLGGEYLAEWESKASSEGPALITVRNDAVHVMHQKGDVQYYKYNE